MTQEQEVTALAEEALSQLGDFQLSHPPRPRQDKFKSVRSNHSITSHASYSYVSSFVSAINYTVNACIICIYKCM